MEVARRSIAARLVRNVPGALRDGIWGGTKVLAFALVTAALLFGSAILIFARIDPPGSLLIVQQSINGQPIDQRWVPIEQVSPHLTAAIIASEDSAFCGHRGVDFAELAQALSDAESRGEDARGASTITMQVAKNLLLWPSRSYIRKGLEIPIALAIDRVWNKRRVMEVYVNIAEWGPGIFGAEAASRRYFKKSAQRLTAAEAALLAVALPAPRTRDASRPGPQMQRLARVIEDRVRRSPRGSRCIVAKSAPE
jgi:monofunctional glycosyltransferase